jgi:transcriptional regulator with XRE-family HTH domain
MFGMVDESGRTGVQAQLAANLRRLRIARHLSLSELARATAIGKATLSSIENGHANPTVETLAGLAGALRVPISELLEEPPLGEIRIVRAPPRSRAKTGRRAIEALAGLPGDARLEELTLPARRLHAAPSQPAGSRIHLYVVSGMLIAGPVERITELGAGDYMSFPSDVAHQFEAGRTVARALLLTAHIA